MTAPLSPRRRAAVDTCMRNRKATWPGNSLIASRLGWSRLENPLRSCVENTTTLYWSETAGQGLGCSISVSLSLAGGTAGALTVRQLKLACVHSVRFGVSQQS